MNGLSLSKSALDTLPLVIARPNYDRSKVTAGIVHFGVGNFHRVHQALYIDRCLHLPGQAGWGIVGVSLGIGADAAERVRLLKQQDCLYSLTEYASDGSHATRVIGALIDYLHAPESPGSVLEVLSQEQIKVVTLTITEGGYNLDEVSGGFILDNPQIARDLASPKSPTTAFGFIVEALSARREAGIEAFTVCSCDNLRGNGDVARKAIVSFAAARSVELAEWIDSNVSFPNGMVDRIAPTVTASVREDANRESRIEDASPVIGESYLQWVLEDHFPTGRPLLERVGVELRDDVKDFERIKGRLLNASHMMLSYPAILSGHRFVHEAIADPRCKAYLRDFMFLDVIPRITGPKGVSLERYAEDVLERFSNPAVGDQLLRIAHDGLSKLPIFLTATLGELRDDHSSDIRRVALELACFRRYFSGIDDVGQAFDVKEPNLVEPDRQLIMGDDPLGVLKITAFATLRLFESERFVAVFTEIAAKLKGGGTASVLRDISSNAKGGQP